MSDLKERVQQVLDDTDEDHELVELSVNRETVDAYVVSDLETDDLKDAFESEFEDGLLIGLDVQKEALDDYDDMVHHVNFKYRP